MSKYYEWSIFKNIYLEDSFVIGIQELESEFVLTVEMVLTKEHPKYSLPSKNEQYCYKRAKIIFSGLKEVLWINKNDQLFTDSGDSTDYGNIDALEVLSKGFYLEGDLGEIIVRSDPPALEWLE